MTEKINKKVSDVSENKLAKDDELKENCFKNYEKIWKNFWGVSKMIILSKEQILNLHSQLINKFGGIDGVRDDGLFRKCFK